MLATSEPVRSSGAHGQKIWAALLVFDAFFVIVFGGALAAKIYQHWQAPPPVVVIPRHIPHQKAADIPAPAPAPAVPAVKEPAQAKVSTAPAPAPVKSDGMKPPKPSLLHEAPRHEAAKLVDAGGSSAANTGAAQPPAAPGAEGKVKAVPVDFKLMAPNAETVELAGPFIVRGGKKPMKIHDDGNWALTLYLTPNTYRYHFIVDGKKTLDPENAKTDRGASVLLVP
jgi:hypothetical protein